MGFIEIIACINLLLAPSLRSFYALANDDFNYIAQTEGQFQRFGSGRPNHQIDSVEGFPESDTFFTDYVWESKPLKMTGAAKMSEAYNLWEDDYFLSLDIPADHSVLVETKKKENRTQETLELHFKDFVRSYNTSSRYMVESVPKFLRKDVVVPLPVQCDLLLKDHLVEGIMWFSSGGTKSVVHTDTVDNINCLFRGKKEFIMVDPQRYGDKVDLDHPEEGYADIDVDRVDYTKYPGLAEVEYHVVTLTAGDCLYIPFQWIHQVRSYERNVAVNLWWANEANRDVEPSACSPDPDLTMDKVSFIGLDNFMARDNHDEFRDFLVDLVAEEPALGLDSFLDAVIGEDYAHLETIDAGRGFEVPIKRMFSRIDQNRNALVEDFEVKALSEEAWQYLEQQLVAFDSLVNMLLSRWDSAQRQRQARDEL